MLDCLKTPEVLLPRPGLDLQKWATVACDQYTSEPRYWDSLDAYVGEALSLLRCTFPEVYLGKDDGARIAAINDTIRAYLAAGIFTERRGCVLVERTSLGRTRVGLLAAVDLEAYSFRSEDRALIRATEGTILSRIPPRVRIREHAPAEFPHIMLLADDREFATVRPLYERRDAFEPLYDFELNGGGGRLRGWLVPETVDVAAPFAGLLEPAALRRKYGTEEPILFAVGDGNHSLATAKACWEALKAKLTPAEQAVHPARYALAEIVNIHDPGICFEPIHRLVTGVDRAALAADLAAALTGTGSVRVNGTKVAAPADTAACYAAVQGFLDGYLAAHGGSVDYIHGAAALEQLTAESGGVGIAMPALGKNDLFAHVLKRGPLPRKTFSMGEANEKRYYLEGRLIVPRNSVSILKSENHQA